MPRNVFVGFGFGAIQGGLFLYEAFRCGRFDRIVVAEVLPDVVNALRRAGGRYTVHVATRAGLESHVVEGVEALNPVDDRGALLAAVAEATEICTALPSVAFYDRGAASVAQILAAGLAGKKQPCVVYAAENHNHAAELLHEAVCRHGPAPDRCQFLNTVIGKMSGVGAGPGEFLVEAFNRILISRITLPGFQRSITVFEEKPDLLPFEEAKLYGHNAVHALIGFVANRQGCRFMSEADASLLQIGRDAFLEESGPALIARHAGVDPLFTAPGFTQYADNLLSRMVNPWLRDAVARVIRDPQRKLGWNDRLVGTMRLALDAGVVPSRFASAAAAALELVGGELEDLWPEPDNPPGRRRVLKELILHAR